jgi:hypothetical protein
MPSSSCSCLFHHDVQFEKMLYDNAQLVATYLAGYQAAVAVANSSSSSSSSSAAAAASGTLQRGGSAAAEHYAQVARGVLDYMRRDLLTPQGGVCSAQVSGAPVLGCVDLLCLIGKGDGSWVHQCCSSKLMARSVALRPSDVMRAGMCRMQRALIPLQARRWKASSTCGRTRCGAVGVVAGRLGVWVCIRLCKIDWVCRRGAMAETTLIASKAAFILFLEHTLLHTTRRR